MSKLIFSTLAFALTMLLTISAGCGSAQMGTPSLSTEDFAGTWIAYYSLFRSRLDPTGVETITFRSDGKYQQTYTNGNGYTYESPWNDWRLDSDGLLRLRGGRWYPSGPAEAEAYGPGAILRIQVKGKTATFDLGEEILLIPFTRNDALVLEHVPFGDPDSPLVVHLARAELYTPEP